MKIRNTKDGSEAAIAGPRLLTVADVAAMLSISRRSVWRLMAARELEVVRLGRSVRLKASSIEAFIERGGVR